MLASILDENDPGVAYQLTICKEGEGISVVESRVHGKLANGVVSVSVVTAERCINTRGVSELVENSGGLVLTVAAVGDRWQVVEAWAVDNEILRWKCVCKDTGLAFSIGVITGVTGHSPAGGTRFGSNGLQTFNDLSNGLRIGGVEILLELAGVLACNSGSSSSKTGGVLQSVQKISALLAGRALGHVGATVNRLDRPLDGSSHCSVNTELKFVGLVTQSTSKLSLVGLRVWNDTLRHDMEIATISQVGGRSNIELLLDSLARANRNKNVRRKVESLNTSQNSIKLNFIAFWINVMSETTSI